MTFPVQLVSNQFQSHRFFKVFLILGPIKHSERQWILFGFIQLKIAGGCFSNAVNFTKNIWYEIGKVIGNAPAKMEKYISPTPTPR